MAGLLATHCQTQHIVGLKGQCKNLSHPPRGGSSYLPDILSKHGGAAIFPSRGVPRVGDDADGATRALHAPSREGHYDHFVGCQHPPSMVSPL